MLSKTKVHRNLPKVCNLQHFHFEVCSLATRVTDLQRFHFEVCSLATRVTDLQHFHVEVCSLATRVTEAVSATCYFDFRGLYG